MKEIEIRDTRNGNWFWIENAVLTEYVSKIGALGFTLYSCLAMLSRNSPVVSSSYSQLGKLLNLSPRTIMRTIQTLIDAGLIAVEKRIDKTQGQEANIYTLLAVKTSSSNQTINSFTNVPFVTPPCDKPVTRKVTNDSTVTPPVTNDDKINSFTNDSTVTPFLKKEEEKNKKEEEIRSKNKNIHVQPKLDGDIEIFDQPKTDKTEPAKEVQKTKKRKPLVFIPMTEFSEPIKEIFEFWKAEMNHPGAILGTERGIAIQNRLLQGYSVEQIKQAVLGCKASPHHMGLNPQSNPGNTIYDDIELICRNCKNVEGFIGRYLITQPKPKAEPQNKEGKPVERRLSSLEKMDLIDKQRLAGEQNG